MEIVVFLCNQTHDCVGITIMSYARTSEPKPHCNAIHILYIFYHFIYSKYTSEAILRDQQLVIPLLQTVAQVHCHYHRLIYIIRADFSERRPLRFDKRQATSSYLQLYVAHLQALQVEANIV